MEVGPLLNLTFSRKLAEQFGGR